MISYSEPSGEKPPHPLKNTSSERGRSGEAGNLLGGFPGASMPGRSWFLIAGFVWALRLGPWARRIMRAVHISRVLSSSGILSALTMKMLPGPPPCFSRPCSTARRRDSRSSSWYPPGDSFRITRSNEQPMRRRYSWPVTSRTTNCRLARFSICIRMMGRSPEIP